MAFMTLSLPSCAAFYRRAASAEEKVVLVVRLLVGVFVTNICLDSSDLLVLTAVEKSGVKEQHLF
jgi:hypothetical protein